MRLSALASTRLTLAALLVLAAGVSVYAGLDGASRAWVVAPLVLLAVNLVAALATNASFRTDLPLAAFHLALLAVVVLAAAGQLTSLKARIELAEGEAFTGEFLDVRAGPLYAGDFRGAAFVNEGYRIRYAPGVKRAETLNVVHVVDRRGPGERQVIGDNEPLRLAGHRFYTSPNKGYSLVFRWQPDRGASERGTVNLPAYPLHEHRQALEWRLPAGGPAIWTLLQFDQAPLDENREFWLGKPEAHHVVVRQDGDRWQLLPGASVRLASGVLVYEGLAMWMGYNVFYDWSLPWILAASLCAVAALAWHFARKFGREPWDA